MKRKLVKRDSERLKLITNILAHPEIANPNGETIFQPQLIEQLRLQIETFTTAITERKEAVYDRRDARRTLQTDLEDLITEIRIIWHRVRGRVRCKRVASECYGLFGLSVDGKQPAINKQRGWLTMAEQILDGDLIAESRGIEGMEIRRESMSQLIETVRTQIETLEQKTNRMKETVQRLMVVRQEVDSTIRKITISIELAYVNHSQITKRELMRVLGFSFRGEPTQETELEQTA